MDFREILEIPHTFRNCAIPPLILDQGPELANGDIRMLAAGVRQIMDGRTAKAAGVMAVKAVADLFGQMPPYAVQTGRRSVPAICQRPVVQLQRRLCPTLSGGCLHALVDLAFVIYPIRWCMR